MLVAWPLAKILWPPASAAAVVLEDGKILAIDTGDYLMLPGGTVKYGEEFEETAVRETEEETGVKIEILRKIKETVNDAGGNESIFLAKPVTRETGNNWEGTARWIETDELKQRQWRFNRDVKSLVEECGKQS